ncbi:MAG: STAS domain-containing protein [Rubripirellula sp.]|nr:STAS domain-containing protein [Rubripirellula sp.]
MTQFFSYLCGVFAAMESTDESKPSYFVIKLPKVLDNVSAESMQSSLDDVSLSDGQVMVLDMTSTEFISSAGIRLLIVVTEKFRKIGGQVLLAGLSKNVQYTLKICGLSKRFSLHESVETAIASLSQEN